MKLWMRCYSHLKVSQEREGRGWQLLRDVLGWHTLVAEEGCMWDISDWRWMYNTAFVLPFMPDDDTFRSRMYWPEKDLHHKIGAYSAVPLWPSTSVFP
jgi:hypothetical protein